MMSGATAPSVTAPAPRRRARHECPKFKQARVNGGSSYDSQSSQMCHLISDAHEWINEIPTVPIYRLAKPQPRERAWDNQR